MMLHLGKELRAYLVGEDIVRLPSEEESTLPACWVQPVGGVPGPGDGAITVEQSDPVVGLMSGVGIAPAPFEQKWLTRDGIDVVIRASEAELPAAFELGRTIRRALADRRGFQAGSLRVEEVLETSPLQVVVSDPAQGVTLRATYLVTVRDSSYGS